MQVQCNKSVLKIILLLSFLLLQIFSCGKNQEGSTNGANTPEGEAVSFMVAAFQIPAPDGSYVTRSGSVSSFPQMEDNARAVVSFMDLVAAPLKESALKIDQTIKEGTQKQGMLFVVHTGINSQLVGSKDEDKGIINWTYSLAGRTVFVGNSALTGSKGDFSFAESQFDFHWDQSTVENKLVRNMSIRKHNGTGSLVLKLTYEPNISQPKVELVAGSANGQSMTGAWGQEGGSYLADQTKLCWGQDLRNIACTQ